MKFISLPIFNDIHQLWNFPLFSQFKVNKEVLKTQNLNVSVWHNDTFGRNSFLGEVELDLSEWDFNNTRINEYMLKSRVRLSFLQQKIVMTFTHLLSLLFRCQH